MFQNEDNYVDLDIEQQKHMQAPSSARPRFMNEIMQRHRNIKRNQERRHTTHRRNKENDFKQLIGNFISTACVKEEEVLEKKVINVHGNKIDGSFRNGNLHGFVVIQYASGQYFQGTYFDGERVEGLVKFKDGTEYKGGFLKDTFHGDGSLKDPAGRIITCEWREGQVAKKGKIEYPSGQIYYGQIQKFKKHGKGHLFFKNGNKYVGSFVKGAITGYGCFYENDELVAEGMWTNGILEIEQTIRQILLSTLQLDQFKWVAPKVGNGGPDHEHESQSSLMIYT